MVPPELIGASFNRKQKGQHKEKSLTQTMKPKKNMSEAESKSLCPESQQGFSTLQPLNRDRMSMRLDMGALTARSEDGDEFDFQTMLRDAVDQVDVAEAAPAASPRKDGVVVAAAAEGRSPGKPAAAVVKREKVDPVEQNKVVRTLQRELAS